jgi:hypothetical protein
VRGSLTDEQELLRGAAWDLAQSLKPDSDCSLLAASGFTDLCTPDSDATPLDVAIVVEAVSQVLCPASFVGSAILASSLLTAGGARPIGTPLAVAFDAQLGDLMMVGRGVGIAWDCVADATVLALGPDGRTLLAGPAAEELTDRFDLNRPCRVVNGKSWEPIGELSHENRQRWLAGALVSLSAELCGLMSASLSRATGYAKQRKQFGAAIGSFQAVQHLLAVAHVHVESVRSAVYAAADVLGGGDIAQALVMARVAKAHAGARGIDVIETALQVHGGIGMTWEFPGHRYLRRAWLDAVTLGDTGTQGREIAIHLLDPGRLRPGSEIKGR